MGTEKTYLNIKSVSELKDVLKEVPNWYPICISANSVAVKDKFKVVGIVVDNSHKKRKVEFIFDADNVEYNNKDTLYFDNVKKGKK